MKYEMRWIDAVQDEVGEWYANETRHCKEFECEDSLDAIITEANKYLREKGFNFDDGYSKCSPVGLDWEEDGDDIVLVHLDNGEPRYVVSPVEE